MPQQITLVPVEEEKKKPISLVPISTGELVKGAWAKAMPFGLPVSETIGHLATAPIGFVGGLVGGAGKLVRDLIPGGEKPSFVSVRKTMEKTGEALTYKPQTPEAQKMTRVILSPLEAIGAGQEKLAGLVSKNPEVQAATKIATDIGLAALLGRVGRGGKVKPETMGGRFKPVSIEKPKPIIPEVEPINPTFEQFGKLYKTFRKQQPEQAAMYAKERAGKFGEGIELAQGLEGKEYFETILSRMGGELEKVSFKHDFKPEQIRELYTGLKNSPWLSNWEKLSGYDELRRIFEKGTIPTKGGTELLARAFGDSFTKELPRNVVSEILNIPRSMLASYDLSMALRQAQPLGSGYPKEWARAFAKQIEFFGSEQVYSQAMKEIASRPTYDLMRGGPGRKIPLALTEMGKFTGLREERYLSPLAEKIPVIGKGIRASGRAYSGGLNVLRADVFDRVTGDMKKAGIVLENNPAAIDSVCDFINIASGRGSAKPLAGATQIMNALFFSPRLMYARLRSLGQIPNFANPNWWTKTPPAVRKATLKTFLGYTGSLMTAVGLAKLAGAEVTLDPRSSDFLKIKIGNTRIDFGAGFLQYIKTFAQFFTGKTVNTETGKITEVGKGYKPLTRLDILSRQLEYKTNPIASLSLDLLRGKKLFGEKITVPNEIYERLVPMVIQDFIDIAKDDPKLLPAGIFGVFGAGLQTYKHEPKKKGSQFFYMR